MAAGQSPSEFWASTPREIGVVLQGASERDRTWLRIGQGLIYALAQLVGVAVNNPRKMPKFDKVFPSRPQRAQRPEDMMAAMRQWTSAMKASEKVKK